ncbi:Predicted transcriptional regulator [Propionibacterium australiense]|uniref:Cro/C1-type HTH DNA-binding domain n=2 Tax=Propionibacterium australiense TaxID=119981 RepID=A0A383S9J6_9ACTN|nr:Cro/C1-type HTH DNA-binding domain [Propionibacterium australiense]VEH93007.1 Predicted transcriptional regulator [Propionibacterium australiense]
MTLVELSEQVGITVVNLSVLKNNRAKAIRFSTLVAICEALGCDVGDLLEVTTEAVEPDEPGTEG